MIPGWFSKDTVTEFAEAALGDMVDYYAQPPRAHTKDLIASIGRELLIRFYDRMDQEARMSAAFSAEGGA